MVPRDLKSAVAVFYPKDHVVTVKGVAGDKTTVRVLLNPVIPEGMTDGQIYENYSKISALDRREVQNAGKFSVDLKTGNAEPQFKVIIATSMKEVFQLKVRGPNIPEVLYLPSASYTPGSGKVTVSGQAGANDTVRALLNPTLPGGMGDDQIYDNYASIPALDKKEKQNAGNFSIDLLTHGVDPPYAVVVVTSAGDSAWPLVFTSGGT